METLGHVIKNARETHGMTQEDFSEAIGVSRSSVGMYETDQREPKLSTLKRISKVLSIPLDTLVESVSPSEGR